jgi:PAS domain S-box-containing protein
MTPIELKPPGVLNPRLMYDLTQTITSARNLDEINEAALTCLGGSLGASRSAILLFDAQGEMRFAAWRGLSETYRRAVDGHSPWSIETQDATPVAVEDVRLDQSLAPLQPALEAEDIRSLAFVPLNLGTRLLGKFMVYHSEPHKFTDDELMVAETIAAQVAFAVDIMNRRVMHERIYESERGYRMLIEALGVAVYTTDAQGYITLFNEAAVELWGRKPEIGKDLWCGSWKIFHPDGRPMALAECPMGVALREDRAVRGELITVERPDGGRKIVQPFPTPLHDSSGKLVGAVNVLMDVTDLKESQRKLVEANRAKDDFLGMVSHELRTPLTQLVGNAHLLMNRWTGLEPEALSESLTEMHVQSQKLHRLVDNMMTLSRLERGIKLETEPHLVQRLLWRTLKEFKDRFPATELQTDIANDLLPVEVSSSTIDQVLWNLLTNAQKYGPAKGPVCVTANNEDGWVVLAVSDLGPGVPEDEMSRLFEPYFRSSSTAEHAAGLGLGLSVCKRLLESQGAQISARPMQPRGIEFAMRLPALQE